MPGTPTGQKTSTDFSRLIERIKGGDERALEKLLAAFAIPLRRMADQLIGSPLRPHIDADDLVQGVSMILWRGLREGKFELGEPRQLMRLAGTLLRRQAARAVQRLKSTLALGTTFEGSLASTISDRPMMPTNGVAEKAEREDQVRNLMKRVNDADRLMLEFLMQGHGIAGAARILGSRTGQLCACRSRALQSSPAAKTNRSSAQYLRRTSVTQLDVFVCDEDTFLGGPPVAIVEAARLAAATRNTCGDASPRTRSNTQRASPCPARRVVTTVTELFRIFLKVIGQSRCALVERILDGAKFSNTMSSRA